LSQCNEEWWKLRDIWPDVFLFIVLRNFDVVTAFLQLVMLDFAKNLKVCREEQLQATLFKVVVSADQETNRTRVKMAANEPYKMSN